MRAGRFGKWLRQARAMTARGTRLRSVMAKTVGPWTPQPLWRLAAQLNGSPAPASARDPRPPRDGFETRLALLSQSGAVTQKGVLAEWGIDVRDPTADKRLLDFCLGVPTDQFLRDGQPRALARLALAGRLPPTILDSPLTGYQGADWHEGLTADRASLAAELTRLEACRPAARMLDLPRLRRLVDDWPDGGWERQSVRESYRLTLLRAVSAGHFLRKASGSNG